ncbi:PQQ-binding-like beta-propeller repeat protein [Planctomicrobium sp. SH661]|uniref:outer membrane protein assembly factor BamB family protein n=1 Tax=Planctomicrobium sp. SH661 TaxID=3448124 RepID=UPI003F5B059B
MAFIEIQYANGDAERRELKKQTPITIGRHSSNDVAIDEPDVGVMHCRISWVRGGFEAVAASAAPLDVNGIPRQRAELKQGDLLRIGTVDIRFTFENQSKPAPSPPRKNAAPSPAPPLPAVDPFERHLPEAEESPRGEAKASPRKERAAGIQEVEVVESSPVEVAPKKPDAAPRSTRLGASNRSRQTRPGEEDLLTSPLVLGLGIGAAVLLLVGAIFYFISLRQTTQQEFTVARQAYDEGNYRASIESLQKFITHHPRQPLTLEAQRLLGLSKIRQLIEGATPKYAEGLQQLQAFIEEQRDVDGFNSLHTDLAKLARTISLGAAESAGKRYEPQLLEISNKARTLLTTYSPKEVPPTESLAQIAQAQRASQGLILRDDVYREHLEGMDAALAANAPLQALQLRRNLLARYPQFTTDKKVVERMQRMLIDERDDVIAEQVSQPALTTDHDWPTDVLSLGFLGRTRTDEVAAGQALILVAQDCCYGIEMVTGQPLWRRVIGFHSPFFPINDPLQPAVILFDTNFQEIVRLNRNTGELLWRQPLQDDLNGKPIVSGETLYVPTRSGKLLTLSVQSGELTGSLKFSQPVGSLIELGESGRLVAAGEKEVLYTVNTRPLACQGVYDLGQGAGSIQAPLLSVADYLIAVENGVSGATLHLLKVIGQTQELSPVTTAAVNGRVLDAPVVRGRDLFVPSTGERITVFSLSDDAGQPPLTRGPVYVSEGKQSGAAYLLPGPDRQLWMATAALSRLRLTTDSLQLEGEPIGIGIATQPLQFLSGFLFHARRRPFSHAVTLTRTDRDEMKSDWQVVLGSPISAWMSASGGNETLCAVNDSGQTYRITTPQVSGRKFLLEPTVRLPVAPSLGAPFKIAAVGNHRIAVAAGGTEPRQWIINSSGQIESTTLLPQPPQAPPCGLGGAILFPLADSMFVVPSSGEPPVQPFTFPSGQSQRWLNVLPVAENLAVGVTAEGQLIQLRLHPDSPPYLGEVSRVNLEANVELPATTGDGLLAVADHTGTVHLFDAERLESRGKRQFAKPLTGPPHIASGLVLIEDSQQLHALEPSAGLMTRWSLQLEKTGLAGVGQLKGQLVLALRNGSVLFVNPADGQVVRNVNVANALNLGPLLLGEKLFVGTADGSIIRISVGESLPDREIEQSVGSGNGSL